MRDAVTADREILSESSRQMDVRAIPFTPGEVSAIAAIGTSQKSWKLVEEQNACT